MTALNIQAAQNDIIRQVLNTQDIHLLDRIRNSSIKWQIKEQV
mgnify:CR=1 FL=1